MRVWVKLPDDDSKQSKAMKLHPLHENAQCQFAMHQTNKVKRLCQPMNQSIVNRTVFRAMDMVMTHGTIIHGKMIQVG